MSLYEYENRGTGERREVVASMKHPPTEVLIEDGVAWHRVWTLPKVIVHDAGGVRHKGQTLPLSNTLPERDTSLGKPDKIDGHDVVRYKDGSVTDPSGAWVIRDKADAKRACEITGYTKDNS